MGEQENIMTAGGEGAAVEEQKHDTGIDTATEADSASENVVGKSSEDEGAGAEASAAFEDGTGAGTPGGEDEGKGKRDKPDPKTSKTAENAENARRRREQEETRRVEEAKRTARVEAILEALDGVNPFTHAPMKDESDVAIYETMRKMKAQGLDPVADYPRFKAEADRQAEAGRQAAQKEADFIARDRVAFMETYPDVDLDTLIADADFADYADGKVGRKPLAEIYAGYLRLSEKQSAGAKAEAEARAKAAEERAQSAAAQALANARATPGSATGTGGNPEPGFFTKAQVEAMSEADIARHQDAIWKSMQKW